MLLQLVTIFKANEKQIRFDLPNNLNIFDYSKKPLHDNKVSEFQVTLKNITICGNALHSHIKEPEKLSYNEEEEDVLVYERYRVQIPKESLGTRRRSTIYYLPNLDLEFVDYQVEQVRQRRDANKEFVKIEAGFASTFFTSSIRLDEEPAKDCVETIKDVFVTKCNNHFGGLLRYPLEIIQKELRNEIIIQLRIPPNSFFGFSDERMWNCLGFGFSMPLTTYVFKNKTFVGIKNLSLVYKNVTNQTYPQADLSLREFTNEPTADLSEVDILFTLIISKTNVVSTITPENVSCIQDTFSDLLSQATAKLYGNLILNTRYLPSYNRLSRTDGIAYHGIVLANRPGGVKQDNFFIVFSGSSNMENLVGITVQNSVWFPLSTSWEGKKVSNQSSATEVCPEIELTEQGGIYQSVANQYSFFEDMATSAVTSTPRPLAPEPVAEVIKQVSDNLDAYVASTQDKHRQLFAYKEAARELPILYSAYKDYKSVRVLDQLSTRINTQIDILSREIENQTPETYTPNMDVLLVEAIKAKQDAARKRPYHDITTTDLAELDTKRVRDDTLTVGEPATVDEPVTREAATVDEPVTREAATVDEPASEESRKRGHLDMTTTDQTEIDTKRIRDKFEADIAESRRLKALLQAEEDKRKKIQAEKARKKKQKEDAEREAKRLRDLLRKQQQEALLEERKKPSHTEELLVEQERAATQETTTQTEAVLEEQERVVQATTGDRATIVSETQEHVVPATTQDRATTVEEEMSVEQFLEEQETPMEEAEDRPSTETQQTSTEHATTVEEPEDIPSTERFLEEQASTEHETTIEDRPSTETQQTSTEHATTVEEPEDLPSTEHETTIEEPEDRPSTEQFLEEQASTQHETTVEESEDVPSAETQQTSTEQILEEQASTEHETTVEEPEDRPSAETQQTSTERETTVETLTKEPEDRPSAETQQTSTREQASTETEHETTIKEPEDRPTTEQFLEEQETSKEHVITVDKPSTEHETTVDEPEDRPSTEQFLEEQEHETIVDEPEEEYEPAQETFRKEAETVEESTTREYLEEQEKEKESQQEEESMDIDIQPEEEREEAEREREPEEEEEEERYHTPELQMDVDIEESIVDVETEDADIQELEFTRAHFRKATTFYNMVKPKQGFCTPTTDFPSFSTILLHEGCKKDYNIEKGMCCILGFATKTGKAITITNITNNNCVITDFQVASLSLEILDPHHNTYKPQKDVYVSGTFEITAKI
jgi:hypothetical protein